MKNLYYGVYKGKIVSINEVCSGLKCECICPSCGEPLIAKKGKVKVFHFAHVSNRDCEYGYESSLHILAKDIIKESKFFVLPKEKLNMNYYNSNVSSKKYDKLNDYTKIYIDKVELETPFDKFKPDIVIYSGENKYFIEIYVTHRVDDDKRNKIKEANVDTIEIDLSEVVNNDQELLKDILLGNSDNKYWIYNKKVENIIEKAKNEAIIPTIMHGLAHHTSYCPKNKRTYRGKSYANVTEDCYGCEYCLGITEQISFSEREKVICLAKGNNTLNEEIKGQRVCPICNGKMVLRTSIYGKFYGCSNFPKCKYKERYKY